MKTRLTLGLAVSLLLALGLLSGCGQKNSSLTSPGSGPAASSGNGTAASQAEVSGVLALTPEVIEDGEFESADVFDSQALTDGDVSSFAAVRPFRWWRTIRHSERSFEFAFSDSDSTGQPQTAIVTIHKHLTGQFNLLARSPDSTMNTMSGHTPPESLQLIHKPLDDHWVRRVLLKHLPMPSMSSADSMHNRRMRWRVAATSGVKVTSQDATTKIQSLRVQTASLDTTIDDPLAFWRLRRMVNVNAMEKVALTVTTGKPDDNVFLMSTMGRFRFHNNGDGTYSGTWRAPWFAGIRHVGVNALSHGTLFDDSAPYDSQAWILPYVVKGFDCGDYLPKD